MKDYVLKMEVLGRTMDGRTFNSYDDALQALLQLEEVHQANGFVAHLWIEEYEVVEIVPVNGWDNKHANCATITELDNKLCKKYHHRADDIMEEFKQLYPALDRAEFNFVTERLSTENFTVFVEDGQITKIFYDGKKYI